MNPEPRASRVAALAICLALVTTASNGGDTDTDGTAPPDKLQVDYYGDFRIRLESDFDSVRGDGSEREDRDRLRARVRVGVELARGERLAFGVRLRSGSELNHQSPHVTLIDFDDNDTGDADFNLDRWYVAARSERFRGRAGRERLPFWRQNEMLWDDDVTVAGVMGSFETPDLDSGRWTIHAVVASPPVGMRNFSGLLTAGQLVWRRSAGDFGLTVAGGILDLDPAEDDEDALLLRNGNGLRPYRIWSTGAQVKRDFGNIPVSLGFDRFHNSRHYSAADPDPFTAAARDRRDGWVATLRAGDTAKGHWQAGYSYAAIETLAVVASYAEDDWVRWGSVDETDSSDLRGHEIRFGYGVSARARIVARLYLVEAITTVQDGTRFRIDYDLSF